MFTGTVKRRTFIIEVEMWFKKSETRKLREEVMAMKQAILDAIAQEKAEVTAKLDALNVQIQALQDQLASGEVITAADLDEIKNAVNNIFVPEA